MSSSTLHHPSTRNLLIKGASLEHQACHYEPRQMKELFEQTKNQKEYVQQEAISKASSDIRWRLEKGQPVSNARLVEWEDGSFSLMIGDRHYEVNLQNQTHTRLFTNHHSDALLSQQSLPEKAVLKHS